jgi:hypothetical protein
MQNTQVRIGPLALTNSVANIFNPATLTGGVNSPGSKLYAIIKHIRIVNKTSGAVSFSLYIGATGASAAGTEYMGNGTSVAANSSIDYYPGTYMNTSDFLTGAAGANTSLTIEVNAELGVATP